MNFSRRTAWDTRENAFAKAVRLRKEQSAVLDLTQSNPTQCGFQYAANLLQPLGAGAALQYEPEAFGMLSARNAVAAYYADLGAELEANNICLTTGTSEAYSFLFRLLCDAGDEVLVATPSYPLFEFLADLDDVRLVEYPLHYDGRWYMDRAALEAATTQRTRAIIVVHPNNPTGNLCSESEQKWLQEFCAKKDIALIADEVFLDYAVSGATARSFAAMQPQALTFVLSGISKVCALPQMKCSWIVICGQRNDAAQAVQRLEVIADTFLSLNAPAQYALPVWLAERADIQQQIVARMRMNLAILDELLQGSEIDRLAMDGGWTSVLRVPRTLGGAPFTEGAMQRGVLLQPGSFFGLPDGRAVVSLLTGPDVLREGLRAHRTATDESS